MIHVFEASTLYQVASLSAMLRSGSIDTGGERRVLLLVDSARQPELVPSLSEAAGFAALAADFDDVVDFGATLWPLRPHQFAPRRLEQPLLQKLLRAAWGLGEEDVTLYLESLQVNPARALAAVFASSPLVVHADGLMSYGPTRNRLEPDILERVRTLVYLDLVPGLSPALLSEAEPLLVPAPVEPFARLVDEWAAALEPSAALQDVIDAGEPTVLVIGQYLSDLGLLTAEEETEHSRLLLEAATELGARRVVFKPHPAASVASIESFRAAAAQAGVGATIIRDTVPAEVVASWLAPVGVVSIFSTTLATLRAISAVPVRAVGTGALLHALAPFENSNRVPLVLADALYGDGADAGLAQDPARLQRLIDAVAFAMRSQQLPQLREGAEDFLAAEPGLRDRYIKQRRLRALGLPHRSPADPGRAHRAVHGIIKNEEIANKVLGVVRGASDPDGLRRGSRRAAAAVGSRLVTWSKRG